METQAQAQVILIPKPALPVPLPTISPFQLPFTWVTWRKRQGAARPDPRAPADSPAGTRPRPAPDAGARVPGARISAAPVPGDLKQSIGRSATRVRALGRCPSWADPGNLTRSRQRLWLLQRQPCLFRQRVQALQWWTRVRDDPGPTNHCLPTQLQASPGSRWTEARPAARPGAAAALPRSSAR